MKFAQSSAPFISTQRNISDIMLRVLLALIPGIIALVYTFGYGVLINIILATSTAMITEAWMLKLRNYNIKQGLSDYSALVTAILLAICLPSLVPWWVVIIGTTFAIIIGKHLYGGLGHNIFNPAMLAYVALLISFPVEMTQWLAPAQLIPEYVGLWDSINFSLLGQFASSLSYDAVTMATPLDHMKTELTRSATMEEILSDPMFSDWAGHGWTLINICFALGGLWLVYLRIVDWRFPVGLLLGLFLIATLCYPINADAYATPLIHFLSGGTMLAAFFIASDPVTSSATTKGRFYYAMGIGCLIYIIRVWGNYPDGVAFAVLLMNLAAPTIDHYTKPRSFGAPD